MPSGPSSESSPESVTTGGYRGQRYGHRPEADIGRSFGKYTVTELLGQGGMGVVYRAFDRDLEREVALKVLSPYVLRDAEGTRQESARLLREARAQAQISHPNVVAIFDVGSDEGEVYLAMELVEGRQLHGWLHQRPRAWREIVRLFVAVGRGLAAAHAKGLVHRDFKPANVLVGADDRPRVSDFGLARTLRSASLSHDHPALAELELDDASLEDEVLTLEGRVVGTPAYMAPEQYSDGPLTPACDQYAFCVALWEALADARPFAGKSMPQQLRAKRAGAPEPPVDNKVPPRVWRVLARGLDPVPSRRYASVEVLLQALLRASASRGRAVLAGGLLVAASVVAAASLFPPSSPVPCRIDDDALAGVWDDEAHDAVRRAFDASGRSYARASFDRLAQQLDEHARAWLAQRGDACEATRIRGEQTEATMDLRMGCLDQARTALERLVGVLREADATTVDRATELAATLPELDRCADVGSLEAGRPDPRRLGIAEEEARLRAELAGLGARVAAGHFDDALELADALRPAVESLAYAPVTAELWAKRGKALEGLGRYADAHEDYQRALAAANDGRDDHMVAMLAVRLAWNVGVHQSRTREGLDWVRTAEAAVQRAGGDALLRAEILNARGVLAMDLGQAEEAEAAFREAIERVKEQRGPDDLRLAGALVNLAILEGQRGAHEEAAVLQRRALAIRDRAQGRDHPDTVAVLNNLSTTLVALDRYDEALAANEEARARIGRVYGDEHPLVATIRVARGVLLYEQGRRAEAVAELRAAAGMMERVLGSDHRDLAVVYGNIGLVQLELHEPVPARQAFERALTVVRANGQYEQAGTMSDLVGLARATTEAGQLDDARARWEEVLSRVEQGQTQAVDLPQVYRGAAELYERLGEPARAAELRAAERRARADAEREAPAPAPPRPDDDAPH